MVLYFHNYGENTQLETEAWQAGRTCPGDCHAFVLSLKTALYGNLRK